MAYFQNQQAQSRLSLPLKLLEVSSNPTQHHQPPRIKSQPFQVDGGNNYGDFIAGEQAHLIAGNVYHNVNIPGGEIHYHYIQVSELAAAGGTTDRQNAVEIAKREPVSDPRVPPKNGVHITGTANTDTSRSVGRTTGAADVRKPAAAPKTQASSRYAHHDNPEPKTTTSWKVQLTSKTRDIKIWTRHGNDAPYTNEGSWRGHELCIESQWCPATDHPSRRLIIRKSTSNALWLPVSDLQTHRSGLVVNIRFSDCNQRGLRRHNPSWNGTRYWVATYNPAKPNKKLSVTFEDEQSAEDFEAVLLRLDLRDAALRMGKLKFSGYCSISHAHINLGRLSTVDALLIWKEREPSEDQNEPYTFSVFELVFFNDCIDFTIAKKGDLTFCLLKSMQRLDYLPVGEPRSVWEEVKRNTDGSPGSVGLGRQPYLELVGRTSEMVDILSAVFQNRTFWRPIFVDDQVGVILNGIHRKRRTYEMSIWEHKRVLLILLRDEGDGPSEPLHWHLIAMDKGKAKIEIVSASTVRMKHVFLREERCLKFTFLNGLLNPSKSGQRWSDKISFAFTDEQGRPDVGQAKRFEHLIKGFQ